MAKVTQIYEDTDQLKKTATVSDIHEKTTDGSDIPYEIKCTVEQNKKNRWKFLGESLAETVKRAGVATVKNILLPAAQEAITSSITQVMNTIVYGDAKGKPNRNRSERAYTSYSSSFSRSRSERDTFMSRSEQDFLHDEIVFYVREDADYILREMRKIVNDYDCVTVSDMYELAHKERWITQASTKYGWTRSDILNAAVCNTRNGWRIDLPAPTPIN